MISNVFYFYCFFCPRLSSCRLPRVLPCWVLLRISFSSVTYAKPRLDFERGLGAMHRYITTDLFFLLGPWFFSPSCSFSLERQGRFRPRGNGLSWVPRRSTAKGGRGFVCNRTDCSLDLNGYHLVFVPLVPRFASCCM